MGEAADAQSQHQAASEPTRRFMELLSASMASGRAHLADLDGDKPKNPAAWGWRLSGDEWRPQGERVGWMNDEDLYLEPEASYAVAQKQGRDSGEPLTITGRTLRKRLHERGLLASIDKSRQTLTVRRTLEGRRRDVLHPSTLPLSPHERKPDQPDHEDRKGHEHRDYVPPLWSGQGSRTRPSPDHEPDQEPSLGSAGRVPGEHWSGNGQEPDHQPDQPKPLGRAENLVNGQVGRVPRKEEEQGSVRVSHTLVTKQEGLAAVEAGLKDTDTVALDLETTGLDPRRDRIRLLSLATPTDTYLVDLYSVDPSSLFPVLAQKKIIAHNALFDLGFLASLGFEPKEVADTMLLSQILYAGAKEEREGKQRSLSHSLAAVAKRELGVELDKSEQAADWGSTLTPKMIEYAAKDVEVLLPLCEALEAKIEEASLQKTAEIERRALPAIAWMSNAGVPIDEVGWREHAGRAEAKALRLKDKLAALAPAHPDGKVWNFGSHQQIRQAVSLLNVDLQDTKEETLALYAKEHELIATLRDYRKASKLASTYGTGWLENGYYLDGRIYASWRQLRAATGRMACDHPNLQNIPRSGPPRSYIRAPEGRVFVIADYSQIELRIAAKISGDQEMLSAYAEGRDLHMLTAQSLTRREEVSKEDRKLAKAVNFGLLYGMGAKGLQSYALRSYGIELSLEEASLYRQRFFETYPGLKRWHERERRAWQRSDTETRTLTGRRRKDVQRLTDRLNSPVQGTGADGLKLALALLWERRDEYPGAVPVIVCHDEIVVECDESDDRRDESGLEWHGRGTRAC